MKPYHERKKSRFQDQFKTMNDIFDYSTEEVLWKLISQGVIEGLDAPLSIGKEANIFTAQTRDHQQRIVKIYRVMTSDFTKMYSYIRADARFQGLHKNKRSVVYAWCQREYKNLFRAREAGCVVPTPFAAMKNVLIMECVGSDEPAQKLSTEKPTDMKRFFAEVVKNMQLLRKAGLVHGDLSPYNILNNNQLPVLIDFSQATTKDNPNYDEFFARDIKNIASYFSRNKIDITEAQLKKKVES